MSKRRLEIDALETISDFYLPGLTDTLGYSMAVRNAAYYQQFLDFLDRMEESYDIFGSVRACMIRLYVVTTWAWVELVLTEALALSGNPVKSAHEIEKAAVEIIISPEVAARLTELRGTRNKIHANRLEDLTVKESLDLHWEEARSLRGAVLAELSKNLGSGHSKEERTDSCSAGEWHDYYVVMDDVCPYCGAL